ncbi:hypothetical protein ACHQM5_000717 [Ranunculus cassubicifolius]
MADLQGMPSLIFRTKKLILKLLAMADTKTKQKAMEAVTDIQGVDSILADTKERKLTIVGEMDPVQIVLKLKKIGNAEIISLGPAKEEKKDGKK